MHWSATPTAEARRARLRRRRERRRRASARGIAPSPVVDVEAQAAGAVAKQGGARHDDVSISPVIRQTLLHWAYELSAADYDGWKAGRK